MSDIVRSTLTSRKLVGTDRETPAPVDATRDESAIATAYARLRRIAQQYMSRQPIDHTLCATALADEAVTRLIPAGTLARGDAKEIVAVGAVAMRRILVDHARRKAAAKRGGPTAERQLQTLRANGDRPGECFDAVDLDDAIERFAELDARACRLVELRFFAGLSVEEAAHVLGISVSTAESDWRAARAWFVHQLGEPAR